MSVTVIRSVAVPPNVRIDPPMRLTTPSEMVTWSALLGPPRRSLRVALSIVTLAWLPTMYDEEAVSRPDPTRSDSVLTLVLDTVKLELACSVYTPPTSTYNKPEPLM
jgi:hypothetical protein